MFRPKKDEKLGAGSVVHVNVEEKYLLISVDGKTINRINMKTIKSDYRSIEVEDPDWISRDECRALFDDKCASFPSDFDFDAKGIR